MRRLVVYAIYVLGLAAVSWLAYGGWGWAGYLLVGYVLLAPLVDWYFVAQPEEALRRRHQLGLCERCGYDLTGNTSGRCPECGEAITAEESEGGAVACGRKVP